MSLRIYNTLTRTKDVFEPVVPGKVGMYLCGPTVYKSPHIGHMVGPIIFDAIKRYLLFKGFSVTWVVNITDVDDKLIAAANQLGEPMQVVAERHAAEYLDSLKQLGIDTIDRFPKATDHIAEILVMIAKLVDNGTAYVAEGGNVWFDVTRDSDYGKLSGRKVEESAAGSRELEGASGKRNPADFALWKAAKPGEPSWDSPWGKGRPGWHIECSAMAMKYLGETFDLHGGGDDLKFPHHENELAQSECCTGKPFAKFWLHNGLTTFNTKKISGSDLAQQTEEAKHLREMLNLKGLLERLGPELIRYLILTTHYRRPINFSEETIESSKKGLASFGRLFERIDRLKLPADLSGDIDQASRTLIDSTASAFVKQMLGLKMRWLESMDDDFNTAGAIAAMHEMLGAINAYLDAERVEVTRGDVPMQAVAAAAGTVRKLGQTLGMFQKPLASTSPKADDDFSPKLMELLIHLRKELRAAKNFAIADDLRKRLGEIGVTLEDRPDGTIWRRE